MSFIGNIIGGVVHGIEKSVGDVVHGAEDAGKGLGKLALGALTGDGKQALSGLADVGKGAFDAVSAAKDLAEDATPEGAAVNVLMAGAKEGIQSLSGGSNPAGATA